MNKKASLQLSMNFMITMIIALIVFGLGISLLYKIVQGDLADMTAELDADTKAKIQETLIRPGIKVALPFQKITVKRKEHEALGIGIFNDGNQGGKEYFKVETECVLALNEKTREPLCDNTNAGGLDSCEDGTEKNCGTWIVGNDDDLDIFYIKEKERDIKKIFVAVPKTAEPAHYVYKLAVYACSDEDCGDKTAYDVVRKFHLYAN